jgi:hypothetical protein
LCAPSSRPTLPIQHTAGLTMRASPLSHRRSDSSPRVALAHRSCLMSEPIARSLPRSICAVTQRCVFIAFYRNQSGSWHRELSRSACGPGASTAPGLRWLAVYRHYIYRTRAAAGAAGSALGLGAQEALAAWAQARPRASGCRMHSKGKRAAAARTPPGPCTRLWLAIAFFLHPATRHLLPYALWARGGRRALFLDGSGQPPPLPPPRAAAGAAFCVLLHLPVSSVSVSATC